MEPVGLLVLAWMTTAPAGQRPPVLTSQPGCERWLGEAKGGNDPSVRINMRLCPEEGSAVSGVVQWSSLTSGWNERRLSGQWTGSALELRDEAILQERPEPGWRFCTIDAYSLTRAADELKGSYSSAACFDRAEVELTLVETEAAGTGERPYEPTPPPVSDGPPPPRDPDWQPPSSSWCASLPVEQGGWALIGLGLLAGARRRRRLRSDQ